MKRLLAVLTLASVCALAPAASSAAAPLSVGNTDMQICNAALSKSWIWPHELPQGWGAFGTEVRQGQCKTYHNNTGQLRVYIPGDSYKYGQPGQGYGPCKNAPWDSDPPNSANGSTETYHVNNFNC